MLDENLILIFLLCLFYLVECIKIKDSGAIVFRTNTFLNWTAIVGETFISSVKKSLVCLNPLPPFGAYIRSESYPIKLTVDGIFCQYISNDLGKDLEGGSRFYLFSEISSIKLYGTTISVNDEVVCKFYAKAQAKYCVEVVECMRSASCYDKDFFIEMFIESSFDFERFSESFEMCVKYSRMLLVFSAVFFVYMFVEVPLVLYGSYYAFDLHCFLLLFLGLLFLTVGVYFYLIESTDGLLTRDDFIEMLLLVISPLSIIRISDRFFERYIPMVNPLVLAFRLFGDDQFKSFAQRYLTDLKQIELIEDSSSGKGGACRNFSLRVFRYVVENNIMFGGIDVSTLFRPLNIEAGCNFYCSFCYQQYLKEQTKCSSCGGVSLKKI